MAALLLSVGSLDLTTYIRAQPGEGLAPDGGGTHIEPVFAGSVALEEGQVAVAESASNRQFGAPLWLNAADTSTVLALLSTLQQACVQGAIVQFRPEGGTNISYFDLEAAEIHPEYSHFPLRAGWLKVNLVLMTRPFASTGTTRVVASLTGNGPQTFSVTGVLGDIAALANLRVGAGSYMATQGAIAMYRTPYTVIYGFKYPAASIADFVHPAGSFVLNGGTVVGASGAIGSQFVKCVAPVSGETTLVNDYNLRPVDAWAGRYRVMAVLRNVGIRPASAAFVYARLNPGNPGAVSLPAVPVRQATAASGVGFGVVDLGEVTVPTAAGATPFLDLRSVPTGAATVAASYGVEVNALIWVPIDQCAGLVSATSSVLGPRTPVRIDSYPAAQAAVVASGATRALEDLAGRFRGAPPRIGPMPSGGPSGPIKGVVAAGAAGPSVVIDADVSAFVGNDVVDIQVEVRERFKFLRG